MTQRTISLLHQPQRSNNNNNNKILGQYLATPTAVH